MDVKKLADSKYLSMTHHSMGRNKAYGTTVRFGGTKIEVKVVLIKRQGNQPSKQLTFSVNLFPFIFIQTKPLSNENWHE